MAPFRQSKAGQRWSDRAEAEGRAQECRARPDLCVITWVTLGKSRELALGEIRVSLDCFLMQGNGGAWLCQEGISPKAFAVPEAAPPSSTTRGG